MCREVRTESETCQGGTALWFLAGTVCGLAVGLLFAPKTGREARYAISGTGRDLYGRSREIYERGRTFVDDAADLFDRGRRMASGGYE